MAATVVDTVSAGDGAGDTTQTTGNLTVSGSNRVLWVWAVASSATPADPTEVRWQGSGGTLLTKIGSGVVYGTFGTISLWELKNPTATTNTVYASWAAAHDTRILYAAAVQDVDQTTPKGTVATNTGIATDPTLAVTSTSGQLVLDGTAVIDFLGRSITHTQGAGQTKLEGLVADISDSEAGSSEAASGTTTTMSWTLSVTDASVSWASMGFAVNGAPVGLGPPALIANVIRNRGA